MSQKKNAPIHMPNVASGGSTTPSPIATAESGKRWLVAMRASSIASAQTAATIIETTAVHGSAERPLEMSSATPFHWMAAGNANASETMVAVERAPCASG